MKRFPGLKQIWFQLHWFIGITAGSVLIVIGLSGAVLSFREELIDAITPGGRHVAPAGEPLSAPALAQAVAGRVGQRQIATMILHAEPGHAARIVFAPPAGQRRGESFWVNPYDGAELPPLRAEPFFDWVERLHRWLLLPREDGKNVTGVLAASLLMLSLSGLYLRWPRRPLHWRAWLTFDPALKGRAFLWGLHSVAGTIAMVVYLGFTATGLYWTYDWIRDPVDRAAGDPRAPRQAMRAEISGDRKPGVATPPPGIDAAWAVFQERARAAGGWDNVNIRMPAPGAGMVGFTWLAHDAPHERARNRMTVKLRGAEVGQDERYRDKSPGQQALTVIYPLHMGSYFGLPGRIVTMLAAGMLPLFAITGWMLYLDRRRKKREIGRQQAALAASCSAPGAPGLDPVLVAFASQSGTAEGIALRSAAWLQQSGVPVTVESFAQLDTERLRHFNRLLLVASSFGEGEPPDASRRAASELARQPSAALAHLQYGLLALGDRHYAQFCGFGHTLDHALESAGATRLFPMVEVDNGDPAAIAHWGGMLARLAGNTAVSGAPALQPDAAQPLEDWVLADRELLNPGSVGNPLYRIDLLPPPGASAPTWQAGALAEIAPRGALGGLSSAPVANRRYSIASLPAEGRVRLFVRQARHDGGLGLVSGWLTAHAPLGAAVGMRLLQNPGFRQDDHDAPAIFIGNGSGYAGLRGHLMARIASGRSRNWLIFGERQSARDAFFAAEVAAWQTAGMLATADLVFSRDQPERIYVQDRLRDRQQQLRDWCEEGARVYVCGSLAGMATGVDAVLIEVLGQRDFDTLVASGRYRRDVY